MPHLSKSTRSALLLCLLISIGANDPAVAEDESATLPPVLMLNGQPLSVWGHATFPNQTGQAASAGQERDGQIRGVAVDISGRPLSSHTVRLRSVLDPVAVATVNTDADGRFVFEGPREGRYVVEAIVDHRVIATSGTFSHGDGGLTFVQVSPPDAPSSVTGARKGKGGLYWTAVGAGIGAGLGMLVFLDSDCRYAESLCPLAPIQGAIAGATLGFLIGVGR